MYFQEHGGTIVAGTNPTLHHAEPSEPKLPSQGDSRLVVPQLQYPRNDNQKSWVPQSSIHFSTGDSPGVKLLDALDGEFEGLNNGGDNLFILDSRGITIRLHVGSFGRPAANDSSYCLKFSGYASSTKVEKVLEQKAETGGRPKARSMQVCGMGLKSRVSHRLQQTDRQLSTGGRGLAANSITRSKLIQEVAKCIKWHIEDLDANSDVSCLFLLSHRFADYPRQLFPFDTRVDEQWCLGQGKMKFDHMVIIGLVNVSPGSWSPTICVE